MPGGSGSQPWSYRVIESGSKIGVHSIRPNQVGQFTESLVAGGASFPVVKAVDDFGWLTHVGEVSPNTIIVARRTSRLEGCPNVEQSGTNLDRLADDLMEIILDQLERSPEMRDLVDYWEAVNEPDPPGTEGYRRLSLLQIKLMERAEAEGLKLAIFSLCAGTPEWDEMQAMVETGVFARAKQGGHILALHEGVFGHDEIDKWWGDLIPGSPQVEGAGPLCFRYRYLYHLLRQRDEVVPLVVSEIGFGGGYSDAADALERAKWYDERARQDYWMWGFLPFTLGAVGGWSSQDYDYAYPVLVDYMISIKDEANAKPEEATGPVEDDEPEPDRGDPREQYARVYVLLPPGTSSAWARAVVEATWETRRFTVGGSADDAGIGDLDNRTVVAVNPSGWPSDLALFYQTHYPGVRYIAVQADTPEQLVARLRSLNV